jgi:hypothetical protein
MTTSELAGLLIVGIVLTLVGLDGMRMRKRSRTPQKGIWTSDMGYMASARLLLVAGTILLILSILGWVWRLISG